MTQKIGDRELELRRQREQKIKDDEAAARGKKVVGERAITVPATVRAMLPVTSGKKPVKRKAKRRTKK